MLRFSKSNVGINTTASDHSVLHAKTNNHIQKYMSRAITCDCVFFFIFLITNSKIKTVYYNVKRVIPHLAEIDLNINTVR